MPQRNGVVSKCLLRISLTDAKLRKDSLDEVVIRDIRALERLSRKILGRILSDTANGAKDGQRQDSQ